MKKRIGFILSDTLNYSETFIKNESSLFQELGYETVFFSPYSQRNYFKLNYIFGPSIKRPFTKKSLFILLKCCFLILLKGKKTTLKFIKKEIDERNNLKDILKKVYLNAHVLSQKIDIIHIKNNYREIIFITKCKSCHIHYV